MSYFRNFPTIPYKFAVTGKTETVDFQNLTAYSRVTIDGIDPNAFYQGVRVRDGERPDVLSKRLYGTEDYYWTFMLVNENVRTHGWALSEDELNKKLAEDLPGECLVFLPAEVDLGNDTNFKQSALIEQFEVGDEVTDGTTTGTIYARNVNLGQMFVDITSGPGFIRNRTITTTVGGDTDSLIVRIVHSPASLAVHHFEDGDGDHVDVDYSLDFRGRGPETDPDVTSGLPSNSGPGPDGNYAGGVVGDLTDVDPYADASQYSAVTFREYYEAINDDLSSIRVIRPDAINDVVRLFNNSIREN